VEGGRESVYSFIPTHSQTHPSLLTPSLACCDTLQCFDFSFLSYPPFSPPSQSIHTHPPDAQFGRRVVTQHPREDRILCEVVVRAPRERVEMNEVSGASYEVRQLGMNG
jgi:hypothetical protein